MIRFGQLYEILFATYGPQDWWPADDTFEIMTGALLVQRTAWHNAARALASLESNGLLDPAAILEADLAEIESCVRVAGFFRTKAARLRKLAGFLCGDNSIEVLRAKTTADLRESLLALEGFGPETVDVILLYAFGRPVAIVDEYLRRLVRRLTASPKPGGDAWLRTRIRSEISDSARLNEFHALVVAHGKARCGANPCCGPCRLRAMCLTGRSVSDTEFGERVGDFAEDS